MSHIPNNETTGFRRGSGVDVNIANASTQPSIAAPAPLRASHPQTYVAQIPQYQTNSVPTATPHNQHYSQQPVSSYTQPLQANNINSSHSATHQDHYSTPQSRYTQAAPAHRSTTAAVPGYSNAPRSIEVYHLPESANAAIPPDVRKQFQRDDKGNILFFTTPPIDVLPPLNEGSAVGHTAKYLANKLRRKIALKEQRKAAGLAEDLEEPITKKPKLVSPAPSQEEVEALRDKGIMVLVDQINQGTEQIYKDIYGDQWEDGLKYEQGKLLVCPFTTPLSCVTFDKPQAIGSNEGYAEIPVVAGWTLPRCRC